MADGYGVCDDVRTETGETDLTAFQLFEHVSLNIEEVDQASASSGLSWPILSTDHGVLMERRGYNLLQRPDPDGGQ